VAVEVAATTAVEVEVLAVLELPHLFLLLLVQLT
jgi:hypothetical protein